MKIKKEDNLLIIYLYKEKLPLDNKAELYLKIKELFNKLGDYITNVEGLYEVIIYENQYYGYIIEIKNHANLIIGFYDIKIKIFKDTVFYMVFDDYDYCHNSDKIYYHNGKFYVDLKYLENINKVLEYGDIIYKQDITKMYKSVNINC